MNCRECKERLLEADRREISAALTAPGDPAASLWHAHLRACVVCRDAAERIAAAEEELATEMEALEPALPPEDSVAGAMRESARRRSRIRRMSWGVAAAAAAALLGIRALDPGGGADPVDVVATRSTPPVLPEVEALLDESVMVMETDNENVVVFWFYQGRGQ